MEKNKIDLSEDRPSELEGAVLGIIAREEPLTAYAIRERLKRSRSSYWSGSAGAIYPLLGRIEKRGWVQVDETRWGERTRRSYRLTEPGRRELQRWLAPAPDWALRHTYDPIRVRVFFLDQLSPAEQQVFLVRAISSIKEEIEKHREDLELKKPGISLFSVAGRLGAIRELEARLSWLQETAALLRNEPAE